MLGFQRVERDARLVVVHSAPGLLQLLPRRNREEARTVRAANPTEREMGQDNLHISWFITQW